MQRGALNNYIHRDSSPLADSALRLARVMGVPLDWLVDDSQNWPPPSPRGGGGLSAATDRELMMELATRHRRVVLDYIAAQETADAIDWRRAADEVEQLGPDDPLPEMSRRALAALASRELSFTRMRTAFDLEMFSALHHERLPGGDQSLTLFESAHLGFTFAATEAVRDVERFGKAVANRPEHQESPEAKQIGTLRGMLQSWYQRIGEAKPPTSGPGMTLTVDAARRGPLPPIGPRQVLIHKTADGPPSVEAEKSPRRRRTP